MSKIEIEQLLTLLDKYGVNYVENKTINDFIEIIRHNNNLHGKLYNFLLKELIIDLHKINENNKNYFRRYLTEINNSKGETRFWGHRFELFFHSKLLQGISEFFDYVRRGKDGEEPDFLISKNSIELGVELTSVRFEKNNICLNDVNNKIRDKIIEKNNKKYANNKCLLVIDTTNLVYNGILNDFNFIDKVKFEEVKLGYLNEINFEFGCIFLVKHFYGLCHDGNINHYFIPDLCVVNDKHGIDNNLKVLINILFPHVNINYDVISTMIYIPNN
jgi:hypothetical protein